MKNRGIKRLVERLSVGLGKSKKAGLIPSRRQPPIIILGNQKSGTTAIASLLAMYGNLTSTIDIPEMWYPNLPKLLTGELNLRELARHHPDRFSTQLIKEPNLTFFFSDVFEMYAKARFLLVVRDPRDNIRSFLNRIRVPGNLREEGFLDYQLPRKWKVAFDAALWKCPSAHYIDILADRWKKSVLLWSKHKHLIKLLRYEDFVVDKLTTIGVLAGEFGVKNKKDISPHLDVQFQPKGNRQTIWSEFFGDVNLKRIEDWCHKEMEKLQYLPHAEIVHNAKINDRS